MKIKELPIAERPYEKLELYGEKALSNAELLAIIIKTGTKEETSVALAQRLLNLNENINKDDLNFLRDLSVDELVKIKGIGRIKAIQIKAVCELATRMSKPTNYKQVQISTPKDVANLLMDEMRFKKVELVKVLILNSKNYVLKILDLSIGGTNFAQVSIKNTLSEAIKMQAPKIILVHNHPTGDSTPSNADIEFTEKLEKGAKMLDIQLLDHIVIGNGQYTSIFALKSKQHSLKLE